VLSKRVTNQVGNILASNLHHSLATMRFYGSATDLQLVCDLLSGSIRSDELE
jgi:hypothetical protein